MHSQVVCAVSIFQQGWYADFLSYIPHLPGTLLRVSPCVRSAPGAKIGGILVSMHLTQQLTTKILCDALTFQPFRTSFNLFESSVCSLRMSGTVPVWQRERTLF